jgi:uncharacterized Fe-S center protein
MTEVENYLKQMHSDPRKEDDLPYLEKLILMVENLDTLKVQNHLVIKCRREDTSISSFLEHTHMISEIITEAREKKGDLAVIWLDLANTYG